MTDYIDTVWEAIKVLREWVTDGRITKYTPGRWYGEWMLLDEENKRVWIIQLSERTHEEFDYAEVVNMGLDLYDIEEKNEKE